MASPASAASRLRQPRGLPDMLLYRVNQLRAVGGGMVLRYCEGQFGVTRREWVLLALLADGGPTTPSALAQRAALPKSATSKAVMGLLGKGLIDRESQAGDRRYARVSLSAQGQALYQRILPVVAGINRQLLAALTDAEVDQLDDLLARLQQRAAELATTMHELPLADRRHGGSARTVRTVGLA